MTDARQEFTEIANKVMFQGERICIQKNNKPAFAIVPIEDVETLEALEDKIDIQEAIKSLKKPGGISHEDLKRKLDI